MENLNAENVKYGLECIGSEEYILCADCVYRKYDGLECHRIVAREALALINSYEQKIKELTQANEQLSESYDHLEKTKDELLSERARLTEENENLSKKCDLRERDHNVTLDLLYKAEAENERLKESNAGFALAHLLDVAPNADCWDEVIKQAKADTVRKMQERLSEQFHDRVAYTRSYVHDTIDQIAKEMLEGTNESQTT